jgi:predicted nucleic acid-binding protein
VLLVDTNVLFDVVTGDPVWADWSARQLRIAFAREALIVNAVVYAEFSVGYDRVDEVDAALDAAGVEVVEIPRPALFWPVKRFRPIGCEAEQGRGSCPTSSSAPTPWSKGSRY